MRAIAGLVAVLALGAAARLVHWRQVFTPDGVRFFFDGDPLYHLLQAGRALRSGFSPTWFDPWLSWPGGASVLWPPLWDLLIAATARLASGASPSAGQLEQVAALLPVAVGLATLPVTWLLARRLLEPGRAPWAALLVALLQANVAFTTVGRPDQHGMEVLLASAILLGFAQAATARDRRGLLLGASLMSTATALAFWNWQGSALALLVPGLATALGHWLLGRQEGARLARALALGAGGGAALLLGSVAAWGPPGALGRGSLNGISLLHVAVTASVAAFGAGMLLARRVAPEASPARRAGEAALVAVAIALAVLGVSPSIREGVAHGVSALTASGSWYAFIGEYRPPFLGCQVPLATELSSFLGAYGLALPAALLSLRALARAWRSGPRRVESHLVLAWFATFLVLALWRVRFSAYLCVPLALVASDGIFAIAAWLSARLPALRRLGLPSLHALLAAVVVAPGVPALLRPLQGGDPEAVEAARWMARHPPGPGREGVLAPWPTGHAYLYYAGRPVVVSPFGTDVGSEPMAFASALFLDGDPERVESALLARRVGHLVVSDPLVDMPLQQLLAPGSPRLTTVRCDPVQGPVIEVSPGALRTVAARLVLADGAGTDAASVPVTRLRLVHESPALGRPDPPPTSVKVFEVVPGALVRVRGAAPDSFVSARATVTTDSGRSFTWGAAARAGADGVAVLRVPYAQGANGGSTAVLAVGDAAARVAAPVTDADVRGGRVVDVALGPAATSSARPPAPRR
ncbi:MAG TPA: STT3 domain-containing protein [Anaeromyxobacteraceae bacterium]|nr:STT3 domain-containing protein [Anaeromyxobacteraceae bacterium]